MGRLSIRSVIFNVTVGVRDGQLSSYILNILLPTSRHTNNTHPQISDVAERSTAPERSKAVGTLYEYWRLYNRSRI
jgi:hypothetical protein